MGRNGVDMYVVKIGGTNGSGKSTLAREIIKRFDMEGVFVHEGDRKHKAYVGSTCDTRLSSIFDSVILLGNYREGLDTGGMDAIVYKEEIRGLVHHFVDNTNNSLVIFEGLITGKTYGYLGELSESDTQFGNWLYVLMGTSVNQCVKNITERKLKRGEVVSIDPNKNIIPTYKSCLSTFNKAKAAGHDVLRLEFDVVSTQFDILIDSIIASTI